MWEVPKRFRFWKAAASRAGRDVVVVGRVVAAVEGVFLGGGGEE